MRIAVFQFAHETVTFLPNETTLEDFDDVRAGEALLATDPKGYMGGFVAVAREHADVGLVGLRSPLWPRTGTGSGWITREAFEHFVASMERELAAFGPFDGVCLALHGAMAVRGVARPEAEIARRARAVVGAGVPIAATFDPHGNEDAAFLEHAELAFCVKYFPHYDMRLQGERAARMLVRAVRGTYRPVHATVDVPILAPTVVMWTGASPWSDLVQRALTWEAREPDLFVNVFFGFPWADVPDMGMHIQAFTNGDQALADRVARDMAEAAWRWRERLLGSTELLRMEAGVTRAQAAVAAGQGPVVLADYSDRSGRATFLLEALLRAGAKRALVITIASPEVSGGAAGRGRRVRRRRWAGRATSRPARPSWSGARYCPCPEPKPGQRWACIGFGEGCVLVLSPFLVQVLEPAEIRALGLDPAGFDIIALKSRVHFRRGFDDSGFAPTILLVEPDAPHLGTARLDALLYEAVDVRRFYPYGATVNLDHPAPRG